MRSVLCLFLDIGQFGGPGLAFEAGFGRLSRLFAVEGFRVDELDWQAGFGVLGSLASIVGLDTAVQVSSVAGVEAAV